jgi:hypothetical protein
MSSVSSYSSVLGIDVEDLTNYSSEELEALVEQKLEGMSPSESADFLEALHAEAEVKRNDFDELLDGTEDVLDDAEDADDAESAAKAEGLMEDLNAVIATLDNLEEAADDALQYYEFTNVSTSEDYNVTYDSSELDTIKEGDTIHIEATGGSDSGIFSNGTTDDSGEVIAGTQQVDTNADGTLDTVVDANQDGVADGDFNGDGFINSADLQVGLESTNPAETGQNIFIDINAGDTIAWPPAYNAETDTVSLVVTTADGKTFTIEVAGDANLIFTGSNYIAGLSGGDFSYLDSADPELLKRCYDGTGDSTSFYDHIHPDEVTSDERRTAIPGYNESIAGISATLSTVEGYLATSTADKDSLALALPADAEAALTEMLNALYDTDLIAGTSTDTLSVEDSWAAIMAVLAAYPPEQQAALMSAFVMNLAANDPTNFKNLLASKITSIEAIVGYADYDASEDTNFGSFEKFIITLMEMQSGGVGSYGGTAMMTNGLAYSLADGTEGAWKNQPENTQALNWYNSFLSTMGTSADAAALDALGREQDLDANATDGNVLNNNLSYDQTQLDQLESNMLAAVDPSKVPSTGEQVLGVALGVAGVGLGVTLGVATAGLSNVAAAAIGGGVSSLGLLTTTTGISQETYQEELSGLIDTFFKNLSGGQTVQQAMDSIKSYINSLDAAHGNDILSSFIYLLDESAKSLNMDIASQLFADKDFNNWCFDKISYNINAKPTYFDQAVAVLEKNAPEGSTAATAKEKATNNNQVSLFNESNNYDANEAADKAKDEGFWDGAEDVLEDIGDFF